MYIKGINIPRRNDATGGPGMTSSEERKITCFRNFHRTHAVTAVTAHTTIIMLIDTATGNEE